MGKPWTAEEYGRLGELTKAGASYKDVACLFGRTVVAIKTAALRLRRGIARPHRRPVRRLGRFKDRALAGHPLAVHFRNVYYRCYVNTSQFYPDYGGRGISMADYFNPDVVGLDTAFRNFIEYVVGVLGWTPGCGLTFERRDNDGNYERGNLCLATQAENNNNRRPCRPRQGVA